MNVVSSRTQRKADKLYARAYRLLDASKSKYCRRAESELMIAEATIYLNQARKLVGLSTT
jgi:hypothetical protein